jgi:hypothetical protein
MKWKGCQFLPYFSPANTPLFSAPFFGNCRKSADLPVPRPVITVNRLYSIDHIYSVVTKIGGSSGCYNDKKKNDARKNEFPSEKYDNTNFILWNGRIQPQNTTL